jgi:hypothetical protein
LTFLSVSVSITFPDVGLDLPATLEVSGIYEQTKILYNLQFPKRVMWTQSKYNLFKFTVVRSKRTTGKPWLLNMFSKTFDSTNVKKNYRT